MGHYYRERHQEKPASTTSKDVAGLTGNVDNGEPSDEWTVEMLRDEARARDLPYYGTKAEILERLQQNPAK